MWKGLFFAGRNESEPGRGVRFHLIPFPQHGSVAAFGPQGNQILVVPVRRMTGLPSWVNPEGALGSRKIDQVPPAGAVAAAERRKAAQRGALPDGIAASAQVEGFGIEEQIQGYAASQEVAEPGPVKTTVAPALWIRTPRPDQPG